MDEISYNVYDTAIGNVTISANRKAIVGLLFGSNDPLGQVYNENVPLYDAIMEVNQYCYGQRKNFTLRIQYDGTEFEKKVYDYVRTIPYGETRTYHDVTVAIGCPNTEKAVGLALSKNPIPIIIPCHRVIGKNGDLVGYVGGLEMKARLLKLEAAVLAMDAKKLEHPSVIMSEGESEEEDL